MPTTQRPIAPRPAMPEVTRFRRPSPRPMGAAPTAAPAMRPTPPRAPLGAPSGLTPAMAPQMRALPMVAPMPMPAGPRFVILPALRPM